MKPLRHKTDYMPLFDERCRDYQRDGQIAIRKDFMAGHRKLVAEFPTGTGKTFIVTTLPKEGARCLFVVGMLTLVQQAVNAISRFRDVEADIEQAEYKAEGGSPWTVASWQSLLRGDRWKKYLGKVDLVVVDECHHYYTAASLMVLEELVKHGARVLGVSATCYRSDKQSLLGFYDKVSFTYSIRQAIADGYLCSPRARCHYVSSIDLDGLRRKSGSDFDAKELDSILRTETALHEIARLYFNHHKPGEKAVLFAHSIRQAEALREILSDRYGVQASLVHSKQSKQDYRDELEMFLDGDRELIVNVGCLTTGWDYDRLSEVFIAKPTRSLNKYTQMVGRGTRTLKGVIDGLETAEERKAAIAASQKPHFIIHDITDSSRCHQIKTVVDVLAEEGQSAKHITKLKRKTEEEDLGIEELDALLQEEIEADKAADAVLREAQRKQRMGSVIGMTFDSEEVDILAKPDRDTPKRREFYSPLKHGKYARQPLRSIPLDYLAWLRDKANLTPFWKKVVTEHIEMRQSQERYHKEMTHNPR